MPRYTQWDVQLQVLSRRCHLPGYFRPQLLGILPVTDEICKWTSLLMVTLPIKNMLSLSSIGLVQPIEMLTVCLTKPGQYLPLLRKEEEMSGIAYILTLYEVKTPKEPHIHL